MRRMLCRATLAALVTMLFVSPSHAAWTLEPVTVFEDTVGDGPIGGGADSYQDLVAGTISETDTSITLTFIVDDIPDPLTNGVPLIAAYYWDFSIDDAANGKGKQSYELSVEPPRTPTQQPSASLGQNCTLTGTLWECSAISAQMTVKVDSIADSISVTISRKSLKDETGAKIAETGAVFEQETFFAGIGAFTTTPAVTPGATQDDATMDDVYILGTPRE